MKINEMKTIRPRENWKFNLEDITVWDNFFTEECLKILRYRVLYAKYFDTQYDGYVAIDYFKNQDHLTELIAKELSSKINLPEFQRAWSFVYDHEHAGVGIHCDPSIVNINIWVSADTIIKDESKNGLTIYKIKPPKAWKRPEWNDSKNGMALKYLQSLNIKPTQVPYKSNRAIFFDGAYFHNSNNVSTKEGFENRRISYTMLFGSQLE
jgi:hypothetical protein